MAWGRVDIAKSEIFHGDVEWKVPTDPGAPATGQWRAGPGAGGVPRAAVPPPPGATKGAQATIQSPPASLPWDVLDNRWPRDGLHDGSRALG